MAFYIPNCTIGTAKKTLVGDVRELPANVFKYHMQWLICVENKIAYVKMFFCYDFLIMEKTVSKGAEYTYVILVDCLMKQWTTICIDMHKY